MEVAACPGTGCGMGRPALLGALLLPAVILISLASYAQLLAPSHPATRGRPGFAPLTFSPLAHLRTMAHLVSYSLLRGHGMGALMAACAGEQHLLAAASTASTAAARSSSGLSSRPYSTAAGPEPDTEVAVIGAGVVGLAIARQLALAGRAVLLLEAAGAIGTETSSRNSEVIHAGGAAYLRVLSVMAPMCKG